MTSTDTAATATARPAETPEAAAIARPARFDGYGWRDMHDEVRTYRVRELRDLLTEMGFNVEGMNYGQLMAHALEALRRVE